MAALSDFRSDTVTQPSPEMRRQMAEAPVGDDVLDGDPSVKRLEEAAAAWLGVEGCLFVPSGTMANQIAVGVWTRPGDEVVLDGEAHAFRWEGGALGHLHGVQTATLPAPEGAMDPKDLERVLRPESVHCPRSALLVLEQTHMGSGGRVVPLERFDSLAVMARDAGLAVHLDGARLANAVIASGVPASEWTRRVQSGSLCLSKGLGAPVGSVVGGDAAFLQRARALRKRFGGGMRQSGILAAAGLMALEQNVERLAADHTLARELAAALDGLEGLTVRHAAVETNIVLVQVDHPEHDAHGFAAAMGEHGVRVLALDPHHLRFVTHMDVGPEDVQRARRAARAVIASAG
jgi:threonine aldolase